MIKTKKKNYRKAFKKAFRDITAEGGKIYYRKSNGQFVEIDNDYPDKVTRHNTLIDGLDAGKRFFDIVYAVGYALLVLACAITAIVFWTDLALKNPFSSYFNLAVLMIKVIRLGIWMLVLGVALSAILYYMSKVLYDRELKKLEEEGKQYVNPTTKRTTAAKEERFSRSNSRYL
jgi:hypothetical protein